MLGNFRKIIIPLESQLSILSSIKFHSNVVPISSPLHQTQIEAVTKYQLKSLVLSQYTQGKFSNLVQNVVALPSVLLTACQNLTTPVPSNGISSPDSSLLLHSVSKRFSIEEMGHELHENRFNIEACCVTMLSADKKGESLILPNLKLKVLIEAVRMVLEIVYDERFVTFSYGGRVGMGRQTAIRYLKNSVRNPTWWFTVRFNKHKFDNQHVSKLCFFIEEKIKDTNLISIIKKLFECQALQIELGGSYLGKGFPRESGLCSILINVYFHGLDKAIQETRLSRNEDNPKFNSNELEKMLGVFYNPVKIYAVRYLDEIMVITSGSKILTMDLKNQVVKYLEGNLELMVDKIETAIHSAVSEKIEFLGMELRAVTPSILHPTMSQKAIRAQKKYLRMKEVRLLELKNKRERNRKKLGLKIFNHVFKKLKQGGGSKSEVQIENEVREIFRTWADEVVQNFFMNLEECWDWHRKLSAGDFLSLRHIRDQLPRELIDSYDEFQEQVEKHLNTAEAKRGVEEEERKLEEEEEQKYANRTVEDLTRLCIKVDAPIELVRKAVRLIGFTNSLGRPRPISFLIALEDSDIIKWYAGIGRRWLDFFSCCHNFKRVKIVVSYHLRFSCILTLAEKHESTKLETIKHFTKDLKVYGLNGDVEEEVYFPTEREVKMMGDRNLSDPYPVDGALGLALVRLASYEPFSCSCIAHFCDRTDTTLYRVRLLQNRLELDPLDEVKWVRGLSAIHESLNQKCFPLCSDHISDLYMGKMGLQDIDCTSSLDL